MLNWKDPQGGGDQVVVRGNTIEACREKALFRTSVLSNFAPLSMAFVVFVEWYLVRGGSRNQWPFFLAITDSVLFDLSVSKNNAIADDEGTHHLAVSIVCFVLAMLCGSVELRFDNLELVSPLFTASVDVERWLFYFIFEFHLYCPI
ncbi:hypothetical protein NL676_034213 [Syzygium grande]|nr:hypothetical protein NL676_034213 [Syzygium grande]